MLGDRSLHHTQHDDCKMAKRAKEKQQNHGGRTTTRKKKATRAERAQRGRVR